MHQLRKIHVGRIVCTGLLIFVYCLPTASAHLEKQKPPPNYLQRYTEREIAQLAIGKTKKKIIMQEGLIGGMTVEEIQDTFRQLREQKRARKKEKHLEQQYFELLSLKERKERRKNIRDYDDAVLRKTIRTGLEESMSMIEILKKYEENRQLRQQERERDYVRWWEEAALYSSPKKGTIVERMQRRQFLEEAQRQVLKERKAKIEAEKKARIKSEERKAKITALVKTSFLLLSWGILIFSL